MKYLYLIVFYFIFSKAVTQDRFQKINDFLIHLEKNNKFMGSLSIKKGDEVLFNNAYGFLNIEENITANTQNNNYEIGSLSELFTAITIVQLFEEKKIQLNDNLEIYFPEFKNEEKITVYNLLTNRSGLQNYFDTPKETSQVNIDSIIQYLNINKNLFEPNSQYLSNPTNYYLLNEIIKLKSKKSIEENFQKRIFDKLQLKQTFFFTENNYKTKSYNYKNSNWVETPINISFEKYTLNIASSPYDLTKVISSFYNGRLIKNKTLNMITPSKIGSPYFLKTLPFGERIFYGLNTEFENYKLNVAYYPKENLSISLISNGNNYNINSIMIGILSIYYKLPFPFPNFNTLSPKLSKMYSGTYYSSEKNITLTIFEADDTLKAQAEGQPEFPLTYKSDNSFVFPPAKIELIFTNNKKLELIQSGVKILFEKKEL